MKRTIIFILALIVFGLFARDALAHRLNVYAWVEDGKVKVVSYYSRKSKPKNVPVYVYGPGDKLMVEGRTDEKGEFFFVPTAITELRIVVEAGDGHLAEYTMPVAELEGVEVQTTDNGNTGAEEIEKDKEPAREVPGENYFPGIIFGILIIFAVTVGGYVLARILKRKGTGG